MSEIKVEFRHTANFFENAAQGKFGIKKKAHRVTLPCRLKSQQAGR